MLNGKTKPLSVDHDHKSGKIRGLLCAACNVGAGFFCDDIAIMKKAIEYLNTTEVVSNRPFWRFNINKYETENILSSQEKNRIVRFGMKEKHYFYLEGLTDNKCAICGKYQVQKSMSRLSIDHDHSMSGLLSIRGLLCYKCNFGIGHFQDDPGLVDQAIQYLEKHKEIANATNG